MSESKNDDKIIVFKKYGSGIEAELEKAKLDDAGIECFLSQRNASLVNFRNFSAEIKLFIFEKDFQIVHNLLMGSNTNSLDNEDEKIRCPKCNSTNVKYYPSLLSKDLALFFTAILIIFYPFLPKKFYHCNNCGNEFKIK